MKKTALLPAMLLSLAAVVSVCAASFGATVIPARRADSGAGASAASFGPATGLSSGGSGHKLLYQGHGSFRIVTADGHVIYVDPYAGEGYDLPADLILMTHSHMDHTKDELIENRKEGCQTITWAEALVNGEYKSFDLGYVKVEAVQAGNNKNHDINVCVGYIITMPDGVSVYATGDTSTTAQMAELASRDLHYAFFCCDGKFNMDIPEAIECAKAVKARHSIPYHMAPGELFNAERAAQFEVPGQLIVPAGEEITLK